MPSVAIDTQITLFQKTGVGQYVHHLVDALAKSAPSFDYHLIAPNRTDRDFTTPERLWWEQFEFPKQAHRAGAQLIHQPAFAAPFFARCPVVVTVHDLTPQLFGNDIAYWSRQYFATWMPATYRKVDHFIAVSQHTKDDLWRMQEIAPEKITVIYEAAGPEFHADYTPQEIQTVTNRLSIESPYLMHVGLNPRKNLEFLLVVFVAILRKYPKCSLVIVGKHSEYSKRLKVKARSLGIFDRVIFTDYLSDHDRAVLMKGAELTVFPSLYEGFGLPPLESMTLGVPVVASNAASIPEVVGDGGILVHPTNTEEWVHAIETILGDNRFARELVERGQKQAQKFSWAKTAQETAEVYSKVLETRDVVR